MNSQVGDTKTEFVSKPHFIAYFDILGYAELIAKDDGDIRLVKMICHYVEKLREMFSDPIRFDNRPEYDLKLKVFSDNFVICSERNWREVLSLTALLQRRLVMSNVFIRGALYYGDLFFNDEFISGRGLVEAYKIESQTAFFPRVIVDEKFTDEAIAETNIIIDEIVKKMPRWTHDNDYLLKELRYITTDFDECKYIDYLKAEHLFVLDLQGTYPDSDFVKLLTTHRDNVASNVELHCANRKVLQKYQWCKNYHNNFCNSNSYPELTINQGVSHNE